MKRSVALQPRCAGVRKGVNPGPRHETRPRLFEWVGWGVGCWFICGFGLLCCARRPHSCGWRDRAQFREGRRAAGAAGERCALVPVRSSRVPAASGDPRAALRRRCPGLRPGASPERNPPPAASRRLGALSPPAARGSVGGPGAGVPGLRAGLPRALSGPRGLPSPPLPPHVTRGACARRRPRRPRRARPRTALSAPLRRAPGPQPAR